MPVGDRLLAARQLLAPGRNLPPATASSSAAATETKAPASLALTGPQANHSRGPGRSGSSTLERFCARRHSRKPSRPPSSACSTAAVWGPRQIAV